jgi:hypothetical protein
LALELIAAPEANAWVRSAYAWCLIALIKRHAADGDEARLAEYIERLTAFVVPEGDDLLAEHREKALALSRKDRRAILEAKRLGKEGKHEQAIRIFARLHEHGELQGEDKVAYGWELYHCIKGALPSATEGELNPAAANSIRRYLFTYLKLGCPAPDRLHSLMLVQALRLAKNDQLRLIDFLRLWNVENFGPEDFEGRAAPDGKTYPSLAEDVTKRVCREAERGRPPAEVRFILPFVTRTMERFPENIWLKHGLVKLLRALDQLDEALALATEFARKKAKEYWTWELLGDVASDRALRLSCYAKALTCSQDDQFVGKVRLKFAELVAADHPGEARFELERVLAPEAGSGNPVREKAKGVLANSGCAGSDPVPTNRAFYSRFTAQAEELLFAHLPWTEASLGDRFTIDKDDGRKKRHRRHLYIKGSGLPLEVSVPDSMPELKGKPSGAPLWVQAEHSPTEAGRVEVHRIRPREKGFLFDVFPEMVGVIDHINVEKDLFHFVAAHGVHGTWPLSDFRSAALPGVAVAVRLAKRHGRQGDRTSVLSVTSTKKDPGPEIFRRFREEVEVIDSGLGFTTSDVFIPPPLVSAAKISDGDTVEGMAVLSHDRKRDKWGMKAISAEVVSKTR